MRNLLTFCLIVFCTVLLVYSAWLCDDAFVSFRYVENLTSGKGLTWNLGHRVQGFTHPLWIFVLYGLDLCFSDLFTATMVFSTVLALGALVVPLGVRVHGGRGLWVVCLVGGLAFSKAFVDFSSSGLEVALSYLLFALFLDRLRKKKNATCSTMMFFLCGCIFLNRMDTILIFAPICLRTLCIRPKDSIFRMGPTLVLVMGWFIFATLYFGFPLPNTFYAKLNSGYPFQEYLERAQDYYFVQLNYDPITLLYIAFGITVGFLSRDKEQQCLSLGLVLYLLYILTIGGDFMMGRFFALPAYVSMWIVLRYLSTQTVMVRHGMTMGFFVVCTAYMQYSTVHIPMLDAHPGYTSTTFLRRNITDERGGYYERTGLMSSNQDFPSPSFHNAVINKKIVIGCKGLGRDGITKGTYAFIVDECALTDPFLARLPGRKEPKWEIGHIKRAIPQGYTKSLYTKKNMLQETKLSSFYKDMDEIVTGDVFSWKRLQTIVRLNLNPPDFVEQRGSQR